LENRGAYGNVFALSCTSTIINLPGMKFNSLEYEDNGLTFYMEPDLRYNTICSHCGKIVSPNRNLNRCVRDLGCFGNIVNIDFNYRQVNCPECGKVIEKLEFITPYARVTTRLAEAVGQMCEYMSISDVARHFNLDWKTVKEIDKHYIKKNLKEIPLDKSFILHCF
jgi:transposase